MQNLACYCSILIYSQSAFSCLYDKGHSLEISISTSSTGSCQNCCMLVPLERAKILAVYFSVSFLCGVFHQHHPQTLVRRSGGGSNHSLGPYRESSIVMTIPCQIWTTVNHIHIYCIIYTCMLYFECLKMCPSPRQADMVMCIMVEQSLTYQLIGPWETQQWFLKRIFRIHVTELILGHLGSIVARCMPRYSINGK